MFRRKIVKRCPKGHEMELTWRRCPKCTGRPPLDVAARDLSELTIFDDPEGGASGGMRPGPGEASASTAPPPAALSAALIVTAGPLAGNELELARGTMKIGKAPVASPGVQVIAIPADRFLSREHALLTLGEAALVLRDPGSTNGCFVNDERVSNAVLRDGDEVRMGESAFRVRMS